MTVTGTFTDASGTARASVPVRFLPEDFPAASGTTDDTYTAVTVETTTNALGEISVTLAPGTYLVDVGTHKRDEFYILVGSGGTGDIHDLIITATPSSVTTYARFYGGYLQIYNTDTGLWHNITIVGAAGHEMINIGAGA